MAFLSSLSISASALTAAQARMDVISENLAHQNTTRTEAGGPYRRKMVVFTPIDSSGQTFRGALNSRLNADAPKGGVQITQILEDQSEFVPKYDPTNPDADEQGYVLMPNVDPTKETLDFMETVRMYESNLQSMNALKAMASAALQLGR